MTSFLNTVTSCLNNMTSRLNNMISLLDNMSLYLNNITLRLNNIILCLNNIDYLLDNMISFSRKRRDDVPGSLCVGGPLALGGLGDRPQWRQRPLVAVALAAAL